MSSRRHRCRPKLAGTQAADLAADAIELVRPLADRSSKDPGRRLGRAVAGVLKDPNGLDFTVGFVDGVIRPEDLQVAARNLAAPRPEGPGLPALVHARARSALGGTLAPVLPRVVIPVARRVLREMVGHLVVDATDAKLGPAIAKIRKDGIRLNLNLLGEAVLGEHEAARRLEGTHDAAGPRRRRLRLDQGLLHRRPALRRGPSTRPSSTSSSGSPRSTRRAASLRRGRSSSTWTWRSTATST